MSNRSHELLGVPKHANQHRLNRLTMEAHTDELRIMASAVECYTDELIAALEAAEKRIAELEAREVKLPELCVGVVQDGHAVMVPYAAGHWFNKTAILEMLADAGINIAAAGKGEAS